MECSLSLTSVLAGALASQSTLAAASLATINKTNEVAKEAGAALVEMIEASLPQGNRHQLDIYA